MLSLLILPSQTKKKKEKKKKKSTDTASIDDFQKFPRRPFIYFSFWDLTYNAQGS